MRKIFSILGSVFLVISIIILILCAYIAMKSKQTGEDIYLLGYKPYIISTGSMEPTLKVRGLVVIKQTPYEDIKEGDIVSFFAKEVNNSVCHRVVEITDEGFITKGDNNFSNDMGIVTKENYKGKLAFHTNIYANAYYMVTGANPIVIIALVAFFIIGVVLAIVSIKYLRRQ